MSLRASTTGHERCARDSDWCDGTICRQYGVGCQNALPPGELHDPDGGIIALRIDGPEDTRGKAVAFFASEWDIPFTTVRVRRTSYREDTDYAEDAIADGIDKPYDGWPLIECRDDTYGAHPYWTLAEECR